MAFLKNKNNALGELRFFKGMVTISTGSVLWANTTV